MEALYREREDYGNGFRKTYQEGLQTLLRQRQKASVEQRNMLHDQIREDPDAFRDIVRQTLGWPLTEARTGIPNVRQHFVAEDSLCEIYRLQVEILKEVWMYGILFLQKGKEKRPLVISQHGGLGTPEFCSGFFDSENYNDMTRRILRKGVHVFCPQLYLWDDSRFSNQPKDRIKDDILLKQVGSSITAVEIYGIQRCLDYLEIQPQISSEGFGMIGLSYGGFFTLHLSALDQRIKAALSSCYFNNNSVRNDILDWTWMNSSNLFHDAEIGALVYPRKLWIQVADNDELFRVDLAEKEFERLKPFYAEKPDALHLEVFPGVHELSRDDTGIEFVVNALK